MRRKDKMNTKNSLDLLAESGILNKDVKLSELLDMSRKFEALDLADSDGAATESAWTFISKHFVYKGDSPQTPEEQAPQ